LLKESYSIHKFAVFIELDSKHRPTDAPLYLWWFLIIICMKHQLMSINVTVWCTWLKWARVLYTPECSQWSL